MENDGRVDERDQPLLETGAQELQTRGQHLVSEDPPGRVRLRAVSAGHVAQHLDGNAEALTHVGEELLAEFVGLEFTEVRVQRGEASACRW